MATDRAGKWQRPGKSNPTGISSNAQLFRHKTGYTIIECAVMAGLSPATVRKIERGSLNVSLASICRISLLFGAAVCDIYPALNARPKKPRTTPKDVKARRHAQRDLDKSIIDPGPLEELEGV